MTYQEYQKQRRIRRAETIISRELDKAGDISSRRALSSIDSVHNRGHNSKLNTSKCAIKASNKRPHGDIYAVIGTGAHEVRSINKVERVETKALVFARQKQEEIREYVRRNSNG
jgi:hypothetical protein